MRRGITGIPMHERVRATRAAAAGADGGPSEPGVLPDGARHCWVGDAADGHGVKRAGLLLEWRRAPDGWEGRVVYAANLRAGRWASVEEWVPAALLEPA